MKICHKKNLWAGAGMLALGLLNLVTALWRRDLDASAVVLVMALVLLGVSSLLRGLSPELAREDKIEEQDERNVQVCLRARSAAFSIVRHVLLGACWLCMAAAVLNENAPERQLVFTAMSVTAGGIWFVSVLAELLCEFRWEKKM